MIRWLGTEADDAEPGAAAFVDDAHRDGRRRWRSSRTRSPLITPRRRRVRAGRRLLRPVVRVPVRGVRRGRVSVVSPIVATESLWGVTLSWLVLRKSEQVGARLVAGAALVVAGGVLIGIYR